MLVARLTTDWGEGKNLNRHRPESAHVGVVCRFFSLWKLWTYVISVQYPTAVKKIDPASSSKGTQV